MSAEHNSDLDHALSALLRAHRADEVSFGVPVRDADGAPVQHLVTIWCAAGRFEATHATHEGALVSAMALLTSATGGAQ